MTENQEKVNSLDEETNQRNVREPSSPARPTASNAENRNSESCVDEGRFQFGNTRLTDGAHPGIRTESTNEPILRSLLTTNLREDIRDGGFSALVSSICRGNSTPSNSVRDIAGVLALRRRRRSQTNNTANDYERLEKLRENSNAVVWRASYRPTNEIVALKKLISDPASEGICGTALRETQLVKSLSHANIVNVKKTIFGSGEEAYTLYMTFEYITHDLWNLENVQKVKFSMSQCKNIARQILCGLIYYHSEEIIHRDITFPNIRIDESGLVKIWTSSLAFKIGGSRRPLTNIGSSLCYRSPELLLGKTSYGTEVDMWSFGCLLAQLISGTPLLLGRDIADHLDKTWRLVGSPNEILWNDWRSLPNAANIEICNHSSSLKTHLQKTAGITDTCVDFIKSFLVLNPEDRCTAANAVNHEWFSEAPRPCPNIDLLSGLKVTSQLSEQEEKQ